MDIQQPVQQQPSEQPINPQPVQPVPAVTRPPQNSWKIIILVVIGVLVLGGASYGAYYYYYNWQTQKSIQLIHLIIPNSVENQKVEARLENNSKYPIYIDLTCDTIRPDVYDIKDINRTISGNVVLCASGKNSTTEAQEIEPGNSLEFSWESSFDNLKEGQYEMAMPFSFFKRGLRKNKAISTFKFADPTADWKIYKNDEYGFEVKYPTDWVIEGDMFKPQTKRIPENITLRIDARKRNLALPYEFIPPTAAAIPVSGNKLEEYKVKVGDNTFYYGMGQFEGDWDIEYEILNSKQSEIVSFDLKISGGRQRMDYYLPESEVKPELQIFNQILSTFKFTK